MENGIEYLAVTITNMKHWLELFLIYFFHHE